MGYRYLQSGFIRNVVGLDPASITQANSWGIGSLVQGFVQNDIGRQVTSGGRLSASWKPLDRLDLSVSYLEQEIEENGYPVSTTDTGRDYYQISFPLTPAGVAVSGQKGL